MERDLTGVVAGRVRPIPVIELDIRAALFPVQFLLVDGALSRFQASQFDCAALKWRQLVLSVLSPSLFGVISAKAQQSMLTAFDTGSV